MNRVQIGSIKKPIARKKTLPKPYTADLPARFLILAIIPD
jgi:hypothetical protein